MYLECRDFLCSSGIEAELNRKILLALSEAFTNAAVHGNSLDSDKKIYVTVVINEDDIIADIIDEGKTDPEKLYFQEMPDPWQEGGRGIILMEKLADSVTFKRNFNSGGLQVTMKFLAPKLEKKR
jgi:anti-sigma regulatory factor (Ser/Thr protein kinase)